MIGDKSRLFVSDSWDALEQKLAFEIEAEKSQDPLKAVVILAGSRLLAEHLELAICPQLNQKGLGLNLRFIIFPGLVDRLYYTEPLPEYRPKASHFLRLVLMKEMLENLPDGHYFGPVKESSGLAEALVSEHETLKDGLILGGQLEKLKKSFSSAKSPKKLSVLFGLFETFDQRLKNFECDYERFLIAIQRSQKFSDSCSTGRLFIYGFYDYTAIQKQLIRSIAKAAELACFMVKPELDFFAGYTQPVFDFYTKELGLEPEKIAIEQPSSDLAGFHAALAGRSAPAKSDGTVSIIFAPGIEREALEVCREISRLCRERGLGFDQIGVLIRDLSNYRAAFEQAFERYGIPCYLSAGKPLSEFSAIRGLLRLLKIPEQEYSRESVIRFLLSQSVKSEFFGEAGREVSALMDIASREAYIIKGEAEWKERLEAYLESLGKSLEDAQKKASRDDEDERDPAQKIALIRKKIRAAQKLLEITAALFQELEDLKKQKTFKSFSGKTAKLAEKYLDFSIDRERAPCIVWKNSSFEESEQRQPSPPLFILRPAKRGTTENGTGGDKGEGDHTSSAPAGFSNFQTSPPHPTLSRQGRGSNGLFQPIEGEPDDKAEIKAELDELLSEIAEVDAANVPAQFDTFLELLLKGLSGKTIRQGKFRQGKVCLAELMAARGVLFNAVIIPGLGEGSFPLKLSESPILADDDRSRINQELSPGSGLAEKWRLTQEERLLFYLACRQGREFLGLSSSWLDLESNREEPASYLLVYALSRFLGREIDFDKLRELSNNDGPVRFVELSDFAPAQKELALNGDDFERLQLRRAKSLNELKHLLKDPSARGAIQAARERWTRDRLGAFTGYIGGQSYQPGNFSLLSQKVSASRLQAFLGCPFKYFLERVLSIEELEKPAAQWNFDRLAQGSLIHEVMEKLFTELNRAEKLKDAERFKTALKKILTEDGLKFLIREFPAARAIAKLELEEIYAYLTNRCHALLPEPGIESWENEKDFSENPCPLELGAGQKVCLSGRVDRLDIGKDRLLINDYKIGDKNALRQDPLRQLQLPIYLLCVMNALSLPTRKDKDKEIPPENVKARFLVLKPQGLSDVDKSIEFSGDKKQDYEAELRKIVKAVADGIEQGVFVPLPRAKKRNCEHCGYPLVCSASISAFEKKSKNRLIRDLIELVESMNFKEKKDEREPKE